MLILFQQHRSHQSRDRTDVGEEAHYAVKTFGLFVDTPEKVVAPDFRLCANAEKGSVGRRARPPWSWPLAQPPWRVWRRVEQVSVKMHEPAAQADDQEDPEDRVDPDHLKPPDVLTKSHLS